MPRSIDPETALDYALRVSWWKRWWRGIVRKWGKRKVAAIQAPDKISRPVQHSVKAIPAATNNHKLELPSGRVETISQVLMEDARLRFKHGPIVIKKADGQVAQPVGIWRLSSEKGDPEIEPIGVAHNDKTGRYAIVLRSPQGWLFWCGPTKKVFARLGENEVWTCPNRKTVLITAGFLYGSVRVKKR